MQEIIVDPGTPSTSTVRSNRFDRKTMLYVRWNQRGKVCYELLKPVETVNTKHYQPQLTDLNHSMFQKRPERGRTERGNTKSFFFMIMFQHIRQNLNWFVTRQHIVLRHAVYSSDLAPSEYHLFALMGHALAEQRFASYEDVKKWLGERFSTKAEDFYWRCFHKLFER